uniref:Uncharacterized protein n=1 Tax=Ciona intestinalis TaxID=7719 RepID=H2XRY2_CIOIN
MCLIKMGLGGSFGTLEPFIVGCISSHIANMSAT